MNQNKCALSGLPLSDDVNSPYYAVKDGDRFLCKWVYDGKGKYTDDEFIDSLVAFRRVHVSVINWFNESEDEIVLPLVDTVADDMKIIYGIAVQLRNIYWLKGLDIRIRPNVVTFYTGIRSYFIVIDDGMLAFDCDGGLSKYFGVELIIPDAVERLLEHVDRVIMSET